MARRHANDGHNPPTIHEVAEAAGVSKATVSNSINHPQRVAPETLKRVREEIDRLGFIRNNAARSLATRGTDGLGLVVPDIRNSLFVDLAHSAQSTAHELGLHLLLANSRFSLESLTANQERPDQQDELLDYFAESRVSGILLATMRDPSDGIQRIREHVRPLVVVNYDQPESDWCSVLMDNEQVGRLSIEHLDRTGIRRVYYVSPPDLMQPIALRRAGVRDEARKREVELFEVEATDLDVAGGRAAAGRVLDSQAKDNSRFAFLCVTDSLALGVLEVIRERGDLDVPDQVSVMGMDANHDANHSDWITLTSFEFPGQTMGERAVRLLAEELTADSPHTHKRVVLPVSVRERGSTVSRP